MQVDVAGNVTERHGRMCVTLLQDESCFAGVQPELLFKRVVPQSDHKSSEGKPWAVLDETAWEARW